MPLTNTFSELEQVIRDTKVSLSPVEKSVMRYDIPHFVVKTHLLIRRDWLDAVDGLAVLDSEEGARLLNFADQVLFFALLQHAMVDSMDSSSLESFDSSESS